MFIPFNVISLICYFNCCAFCFCPQLNGSSFDALLSNDDNWQLLNQERSILAQSFLAQQLI